MFKKIEITLNHSSANPRQFHRESIKNLKKHNQAVSLRNDFGLNTCLIIFTH